MMRSFGYFMFKGYNKIYFSMIGLRLCEGSYDWLNCRLECGSC